MSARGRQAGSRPGGARCPAQVRGRPDFPPQANAGDATLRAYVLDELMTALQIPDAAQRQSAMIATFQSGGRACSSAYRLCFGSMHGLQ